MCGRFCLFSSAKELSNDLGIHINETIEPSYNVSPGDTVLSIYFNFEKQKRARRRFGREDYASSVSAEAPVGARGDVRPVPPRRRG